MLMTSSGCCRHSRRRRRRPHRDTKRADRDPARSHHRLAARLGLPAIYSFGFYAASGGLMSYGIDQLELVRAAASYVDRILRGTNPGELPVQLPIRYELVIDLKIASALGLAVPNSLQLLADEVIE